MRLFAALLYIHRVTSTTTVAKVTPDYVEQGRPHLNEEVDFTVTSALQTSAGRMIFGRIGADAMASRQPSSHRPPRRRDTTQPAS